MDKKHLTEQERRHWAAVATTSSVSEVARLTGRKEGTVRGWMRKFGSAGTSAKNATDAASDALGIHHADIRGVSDTTVETTPVKPDSHVSERTLSLLKTAEEAEIEAEMPAAPMALCSSGRLVEVTPHQRGDMNKYGQWCDHGLDDELLTVATEDLEDWTKETVANAPWYLTTGISLEVVWDENPQGGRSPRRLVAGGRHKSRCCPTQSRSSHPLAAGEPWGAYGSWQCRGCGSMEQPDIWASWELETDGGTCVVPDPTTFLAAAWRQHSAERHALKTRLAATASQRLDSLVAYAAGDDREIWYEGDIMWDEYSEPEETWTHVLHIDGQDHEIGDKVTVQTYLITEGQNNTDGPMFDWHTAAPAELVWNERLAELADDA